VTDVKPFFSTLPDLPLESNSNNFLRSAPVNFLGLPIVEKGSSARALRPFRDLLPLTTSFVSIPYFSQLLAALLTFGELGGHVNYRWVSFLVICAYPSILRVRQR
jgi:hypothetical protein